ncbi:hypothetical protein J2744_000517 [Halorubrum trapanicum]|uniref:Methanogenesis regulatory protein FilR1 middle domain-containing protein n=1 Tax=Halorubrum trapanicum TaxID=29284 RepID=A0A8J7ULA7_9EURY|nr:hypothetical protein [Halorubrum trapanicum]MBP1900859.1 hypothetical protein [Halorubrum trapanicum]
MSDDNSSSPAAVLRALVASAVAADLAALDDRVEVVERSGGAADEGVTADPAKRLAGLVGSADSVVAVVPRFDADLARRLNASLAATDGDGDAGDSNGSERDATVPGDVRVVFTDAASDRLSGATGPVVRRALADRGVDAYRHDGESPVAVVLADDRAAVGLIDGDGISALLRTDAPAVREWAAATCRRYLAAAESVTDD